MNTKSLVTFKTILEMGSFQKAADKLGYTQSTVTFQIKQLEEELALKLFEKIGRRMELTQAGKDIMPYVDMILQGTEQIGNYGKSLSEISGSLKLAIPDSILIYNMQPFIRAFAHEVPNVQLVINSIQSGEINQFVVDGTADIGINCEKESYPDNDKTIKFISGGSLFWLVSLIVLFSKNKKDNITAMKKYSIM